MTELRIGKRRIGPGHPVYFIAEAGSNHDRKFEQAMELIEVAASAGADAVKFQTFRADALYPRSAGMTDYLKVPRSIHDIIRDLEMPLDWIPLLARRCGELGVDFLSTPFDEASADALAPFVSAFKIASYEMTHHGLVQHCARKGKPLIVSTGTAYLDEVRAMVEATRAVGCRELALMQCTAKYPAPLSALNLRTLTTLAAEFDVPVGLSDHSREPLPGPMAAVAMGATLLEKHFTLSNQLPGPDHAYALEPDELADVIAKVRLVEQTLGTGEKVPQPEEEELRRFARRTIFTTRAVRIGEPISVENSAVLRCGKLPYGLPPSDYVLVLGRTAARDLAVEHSLQAEDLGSFTLGDGIVSLRPLSFDDTDRVVSWRNQKDVAAQLFSDRPPTGPEHEAWFRQLQRRSDRVEFVILEGDRPVGTAGLSAIDFGTRDAELGILVGEPDARGRGVATAASRLLLRYAFEVLALSRLRLALFADNAPARRLYDRLGFTEDGSAPPVRGRAVTRMSLTRPATSPG
jgi:N-acetylneuraminate synthase